MDSQIVQHVENNLSMFATTKSRPKMFLGTDTDVNMLVIYTMGIRTGAACCDCGYKEDHERAALLSRGRERRAPDVYVQMRESGMRKAEVFAERLEVEICIWKHFLAELKSK